ncbi:TRAP transporter small permease [Suttonella sp. R2A3]|uniref:TRAP transporter small permease n=1 Tax=Suttonella sp. R2A3 TaxID=2908648 RepID=UPI001F47C7A6|nr:TRAP transporter small permease [Suttonella sp. R2A3]UJF24216.1 TRAP transporter small permease [Suttonella sp. R2A3]
MTRLSQWIERIFLPFLTWPAMFMLMAMMLITVVDVLGVKLFSAPIKSSIELTQLALAVMTFCIFPLVCWDESHISVDLLDQFTPSWLHRARRVLIHIGASIALALLGWKLLEFAQRSVSYGDVTEFLRIPISYLITVMAVMGWLSALISLLKAMVVALGKKDKV